MRAISGRPFLGNAGLLGAATVLGDGLGRSAHADKPVTFSGWVFKPDTVKDYVTFYNQKFGGQVKDEPLPWVQYHPTMETRALAGELVYAMNCAPNNRHPSHKNGSIRPLTTPPRASHFTRTL